MKINQAQYDKISHCLPKQRGNVKIDNLTLINALPYICENDCKRRALPSEFENWHVIYACLNRWVKDGAIEKLFRDFQKRQILRINLEIASLDSTTIKARPDAAGALKKVENSALENHEAEKQQKFIWLTQTAGPLWNLF